MALDNSIFGTEKVGKLLLKLAPPVMLAQLIQALYNIVDSYFVGKYSASGLAALSVIFPRPLLAIFASGAPQIRDMGTVALRIIAASFTPFALSLVMPAYFQAIGLGLQSVAITVLRQILLLMPLAYVLSLFGLTYVWLAFPITEFTTAAAAFLLYKKYPPEKYVSSAGKESKV